MMGMAGRNESNASNICKCWLIVCEREDWMKLNNLRKRNNPGVVYMHPKDMIINEGDKLANIHHSDQYALRI
jgi:hypothetical protein